MLYYRPVAPSTGIKYFRPNFGEWMYRGWNQWLAKHDLALSPTLAYQWQSDRAAGFRVGLHRPNDVGPTTDSDVIWDRSDKHQLLFFVG